MPSQRARRPRLSDAEIVRLYNEREELKKRIARLQKFVLRRDAKIIAELDRRGTKAIEHGDQRVGVTRSETTVYIEPRLRARLSRTEKGRAVLARVEKTIIDMKAVSAEVQAGNISPRVVAACSEQKINAPYVTGSQT